MAEPFESVAGAVVGFVGSTVSIGSGYDLEMGTCAFAPRTGRDLMEGFGNGKPGRFNWVITASSCNNSAFPWKIRGTSVYLYTFHW